MPSRTAVYGVGAATGILVGVMVAQLNRAGGRERLQRLLGRPGEAEVRTHIVLPDWVSALPDTGGADVRDGGGARVPAPSAR